MKARMSRMGARISALEKDRDTEIDHEAWLEAEIARAEREAGKMLVRAFMVPRYGRPTMLHDEAIATLTAAGWTLDQAEEYMDQLQTQ